MNIGVVEKLYDHAFGRFLMKVFLKSGAAKIVEAYLRSPISKGLIKRFIKAHDIPMHEYPDQNYANFAEFFCRSKVLTDIDMDPTHLIAPCESMLSAYNIGADSRFLIKGNRYTPDVLLGDPELAKGFQGGLCLIFRLAATDYHHYICFDDGYLGPGHFIKGMLHSVMPLACEKYPVYRINRRYWNAYDSDAFGRVIQLEVGATMVGGFVNLHENCRVRRGDEMGYFDLCGSTIVMLIGKGRAEPVPELAALLDTETERRVMPGECIGTAIRHDR